VLSSFSRFIDAASLDRLLDQQLKTLLANGPELLRVLIDRSAEVVAASFMASTSVISETQWSPQ